MAALGVESQVSRANPFFRLVALPGFRSIARSAGDSRLLGAAILGYNNSMPQINAGHIETDPQKCGGRPCIAGTRIRVQDIYVWHELQGQSPEEIVTDFKQLTLADVHAALTYYHDHREAIEAEVRAERAEADQLKLSHPSKLQQKLTGQDANLRPVPSR